MRSLSVSASPDLSSPDLSSPDLSSPDLSSPDSSSPDSSSPDSSRSPRKIPVQARSTATVAAIAEAALQVLLKSGPARLTTTKVAERAGVSVGTLYQYFPNKQSLLYFILEQHLTSVIVALERACQQLSGHDINTMATEIIHAFIDAKMQRPDASVSMYSVAADLKMATLLTSIRQRALKALAAVLKTAPDAHFEDVALTTNMMYSAMVGSTRSVIESGATPKQIAQLRQQLVLLCTAYLTASSMAPALA